MKTIIVIGISPPITYVAKFLFPSYASKCCWPIELQDSVKCNISRKKWMMKFIFGMQRNGKIFYKFILSFWVCAARNAQSTQNRKFAYLCNIQNSKCAMSLQYLRKEVRDEVAFLHVDKHQNFPQIDFNTLSIKVFHKMILSLLMGMIKHFN